VGGALDYVCSARGLNDTTIRRSELGYGDSFFRGCPPAFKFVVREAKQIIGLKERFWPELWLPPGDTKARKSRALAGAGSSWLYPAQVLTGALTRLVVCEGEWDALLLNQLGITAVTSTAGTSWKPEWNRHLAGLQVAVLFDVDAERVGGRRVAEFRAAGIDAWSVELSRAGFAGKTDVSDVLNEHGWSADKLRKLIEWSRGAQRRRYRNERGAA
jgi:DNA primase